MPLLCLFRLQKIRIHILDVDEGPGEVFFSSDTLYPGGFGGDTCHTTKAVDSLLSAWELIDVVDM